MAKSKLTLSNEITTTVKSNGGSNPLKTKGIELRQRLLDVVDALVHIDVFNDLFAGETGGKKQIDWANVINKPSVVSSAENGLNKNGDNLKLGGSLVENTNINGAFDLNFGQTTPLNNFKIGLDASALGEFSVITDDVSKAYFSLTPSQFLVARQVDRNNILSGGSRFNVSDVEIRMLKYGASGNIFSNFYLGDIALGDPLAIPTIGLGIGYYDGVFFRTRAAVFNEKGWNYTTDFSASFGTLSIPHVGWVNTQLAGKASTSHTHTIANITNLQTTLDAKADLVGGVIPTSQIPAVAISEFLGTVANQTAMLALNGQRGDWCIRSDNSMTYILVADTPSNLSSWQAISYPSGGGSVTSVNGQTGVIVLGKTDIGLGNVDNTSDVNKPISTATQSALNAKENTISVGTTAQYWRGDKSWQSLATDVRSVVLTGFSSSNSAIIATDSILSAFGKAQGQIDNKIDKYIQTANLPTPLTFTQNEEIGKTTPVSGTSIAFAFDMSGAIAGVTKRVYVNPSTNYPTWTTTGLSVDWEGSETIELDTVNIVEIESISSTKIKISVKRINSISLDGTVSLTGVDVLNQGAGLQNLLVETDDFASFVPDVKNPAGFTLAVFEYQVLQATNSTGGSQQTLTAWTVSLPAKLPTLSLGFDYTKLQVRIKVLGGLTYTFDGSWQSVIKIGANLAVNSAENTFPGTGIPSNMQVTDATNNTSTILTGPRRLQVTRTNSSGTMGAQYNGITAINTLYYGRVRVVNNAAMAIRHTGSQFANGEKPVANGGGQAVTVRFLDSTGGLTGAYRVITTGNVAQNESFILEEMVLHAATLPS